MKVEIDDRLLSMLKAACPSETIESLAEQALQHYLLHLQRRNMLSLEGRVEWEGDLDEMRSISEDDIE
ncbi:MAG: type II toxin-antitoxin system VapB family antitoxin [bacterium]|nr:type II toxin-antitoxin system VapB family antitoxin [bacterium]